MKKAFAIGILLALLAGCNSDIVTTKYLNAVKNKCVYVTPIDCQDPYVGKVLRDVLEKEFIRKNIQLCDANTANVINVTEGSGGTVNVTLGVLTRSAGSTVDFTLPTAGTASSVTATFFSAARPCMS